MSKSVVSNTETDNLFEMYGGRRMKVEIFSKEDRRKIFLIHVFTKAVDNLSGSLFYKLHPYWVLEE